MSKICSLRIIAREILEVRLSSSSEEIHSAYIKKAKRFHPDLNGRERTMKLINQAYEILTNPEVNKEYDLLDEFCNLVSEKEIGKKKNEEDYTEWHKRHFYGHGVI